MRIPFTRQRFYGSPWGPIISAGAFAVGFYLLRLGIRPLGAIGLFCCAIGLYFLPCRFIAGTVDAKEPGFMERDQTMYWVDHCTISVKGTDDHVPQPVYDLVRPGMRVILLVSSADLVTLMIYGPVKRGSTG